MEINPTKSSWQNCYSDHNAAVGVIDNLIETVSSTDDFLIKNDISANIKNFEEDNETAKNVDNFHERTGHFSLMSIRKCEILAIDSQEEADSDDCMIILDSPANDDSSDGGCEIIEESLYTPTNDISESVTSALHCPTPSTSQAALGAPISNGKTSRRKPQNISNKLDKKIMEVEKWKFECIKQIKKLEEQELPDGVEGELILEKIDKLRKKAIQFEESLSKFVVYEDADYNEFINDENRICVDYKIVITNTDLEPLNTLLTKHVNRLITSADKRCGYRCVTVDHVEEMLKIIRECGDCPVYDVIVPKEKDQLENFILQIVEVTNRFCRLALFKQLINEDYSDVAFDHRTLPMMENETGGKKLDFDCKCTLSERLLIMKSEGLLDTTGEDDQGEEIDLCNSDEGEYDVDIIPDVVSADKRTASEYVKEAPIFKKLKLLADTESISTDKCGIDEIRQEVCVPSEAVTENFTIKKLAETFVNDTPIAEEFVTKESVEIPEAGTSVDTSVRETSAAEKISSPTEKSIRKELIAEEPIITTVVRNSAKKTIVKTRKVSMLQEGQNANSQTAFRTEVISASFPTDCQSQPDCSLKLIAESKSAELHSKSNNSSIMEMDTINSDDDDIICISDDNDKKEEKIYILNLNFLRDDSNDEKNDSNGNGDKDYNCKRLKSNSNVSNLELKESIEVIELDEDEEGHTPTTSIDVDGINDVEVLYEIRR